MPLPQSKWVLVDAGWMSHRARYCARELSHGGIIFSFLEQLRTIAAHPRVKSNQIGLFFDSKKSYRRQALPEYKLKRHEDRTPTEVAEINNMHSEVNRLRKEILPACGFRLYKQSGLESDDLIAAAAQQCRATGAVIVTSDSDLYQCITSEVHWFDPQRNLYYDEASFRAEHFAAPGDWAEIKSIAGCPTDNVPGVVGVGVKTATDYTYGLLNKAHKRYSAITSTPGRDVYIRNLPLVTLPHASTRDVVLEPPVYNQAAFFGWCALLGFKSLVDGRRGLWEAFFAGRLDGPDRRVPRRKRGE